ncbi:hypothetical protein G7Y89_g11493 [Cudoniella acicularis]|uniref:Uncharacterized protein n=1 Tax=Cudoniella acicularis TaxID=354080 RepID=A0A8H4W0L4_9HELO|nr:hypothetical protein G7Y89_g11493 [Cudoniella acicularis]
MISQNPGRANRPASTASNQASSSGPSRKSESIIHTPSTYATPMAMGPLSLRILHESSRVSLTTLTLPPNTMGFPPLNNRVYTAVFHILSGKVQFTISTSKMSPKEFEATTGSTTSIPPGGTYGFGNPFPEEAEILCFYNPGEWVGCLKDLAGVKGEWMGEECKEILKSWGCVLVEKPEGEAGEMDEGEDDDEDEEMMFQPGLRCMA